MSQIITVGSINQDIVVTLNTAPNAGETVHANGLSLFPGGKGANQAIAARLAGCHATMVGAVGNDEFGNSLVSYLRDRGLLTSIAVLPDTPTGTAVIFVERNGENRIAIVGGANAQVGGDTLAPLDALGADDFVLVQNEIPLDTTRAVLSLAKSAGTTTIFNVAPAARLLQEDFHVIDYLMVNEHEFEITTGRTLSAPKDVRAVIKDAQELSAQVGSTIVVTLGALGAIAANQEHTWAVDGHPVDVVDATGAGDCFAGVFAASMCSERNVDNALRRANYAASLSVQCLGASSSFPDADQIAAYC